MLTPIFEFLDPPVSLCVRVWSTRATPEYQRLLPSCTLYNIFTSEKERKLCNAGRLSVCLSVCSQLHVKLTQQIFVKISPQM